MRIDRSGALDALKLAVTTFRRNQMTDNAASLTYFAMLSLFPALLAGVALLGLFGGESLATDAADYVLRNGADSTTATTLQDTLKKLSESGSGAAGFALVVSLLLALNGASGAFAAAGRALNKVYGVEEDRGFLRRKVTDIGTTVLVIALFLVVLVALFVGGGIAEDLFGKIGLGSTAAMIWSVARWFVAFFVAVVAFGVVYAVAPDVSPKRFRWISPGAVFGVAIWLVASALFGIYLKGFSSYGAAYGVFGAAIALLLWLYITTNAFLLGAELNASIERLQTAGRGGPPPPSPPPAADPDGRFTASAPRSARAPDPAQASGGPGRSSAG